MARSRLAVALVVPEPHRTEIDGLRRAVGGQLDRIEPHITVVPPVNVADDRLPEALATLRATAGARVGAIRLTIGPAATFMPHNRVLYLEVTGEPADATALRELRAEVMTGALHREERRAFVPHVTLTNRLGPVDEAQALALLGGYSVEVTFERVDLLRYDEERRRWTTVADVPVGPRHVVGTGGLALELTASHHLDPEADAAVRGWVEGTVGADPPAVPPGAAPLILAARREGRPARGAAGWTAGPRGALQVVTVDPSERRTGVGGHLLAAFEVAAARRGARGLEVEGEAPDDVAAALRARGWVTHREGRATFSTTLNV